MMNSVITFFVGRGTTNRLRRSSMLPKASMVIFIFILLCLGLSADTNLAFAATAGTNKPGDSGLASAPMAAAPGKSGSGEILSLNFEVTANAPPSTRICFSLANTTANDSTVKAIALQAGPVACLTVDDVAVDVVPNPFTPNDDGTNDHVDFRRDGGIPADWVIRLMDRKIFSNKF